jgi:hypothetical protein
MSKHYLTFFHIVGIWWFNFNTCMCVLLLDFQVDIVLDGWFCRNLVKPIREAYGIRYQINTYVLTFVMDEVEVCTGSVFCRKMHKADGILGPSTKAYFSILQSLSKIWQINWRFSIVWVGMNISGLIQTIFIYTIVGVLRTHFTE